MRWVYAYGYALRKLVRKSKTKCNALLIYSRIALSRAHSSTPGGHMLAELS